MKCPAAVCKAGTIHLCVSLLFFNRFSAAASEGGANVFQLGYFKGEPLMPRLDCAVVPLIGTITLVMVCGNVIKHLL